MLKVEFLIFFSTTLISATIQRSVLLLQPVRITTLLAIQESQKCCLLGRQEPAIRFTDLMVMSVAGVIITSSPFFSAVVSIFASIACFFLLSPPPPMTLK